MTRVRSTERLSSRQSAANRNFELSPPRLLMTAAWCAKTQATADAA